MSRTIDSLVWFHKDEFSSLELTKLKYQDLTLASENDYNSRQVEMFEELDDYIGVPRYYYFNRYSDSLEDHSTYPYHKFPKFLGTLRDGQKTGTSEFLAKLATDNPYGGILQAKCGAGKTVSSLYIGSKLQTRIIVLVHKTDLLKQWASAIKKFLPGATVGFMQGKNRQFINADITIGTFQTIRSQFPALCKAGFFDYFGSVIIDECHHVGADTFTEVIKFFSAKVRIGLTATPRRKDRLEKVFEYHIGPILTRMAGETLTGNFKQTLFQSNINMNHYKLYGGKGKVSISKLITGIAEHDLRNHFILEVLKDAYDKKRKVLILSNRKAQLVHLHEEWGKRVGNSSGLYMGGMKDEQLYASTQKQIIFGTAQIFAEGTDIPSLDTLCLISPMSDIEQAIGRIQRLYAGKKAPFVWDLVDDNEICIAMAKKRKRHLESAGFTEQK